MLNKKLRNLPILFTLSFLQGLVFYAPIATLFRQSRGLNMAQIFLIESILLITILLLEVPWGYFADRYGYKKTLTISFFMLFISKIIFYIANSFYLFLLQAVFTAIAFAGISGCDIALIYDCIEEKESEKVFGKYTAYGNAGFLLASLLYGIFVNISMAFAVLATIIPYAIVFVLSLFLQESANKKTKEKQNSDFITTFSTLKKNKRIFIFILAIALVSEVSHSITVFLNQLQYIKSGIHISLFGLFSVFGLLISLLSAQTYKLSDRLGQIKSLVMFMIVMILCNLILVFTKNPWISVISIVLIQGGFAMMQPITLDIQNKSISTNRATMLSVYSMVGNVIASLTNIWIGKAADKSLEFSLAVSSGLLIAAFFVVLIYWFLEENINFSM